MERPWRIQLSDPCSYAVSALPAGCMQYLYGFNISDSASCNEVCGRPIYKVYKECSDELAPDFDLKKLFDLRCAKNKAGKKCADVFNGVDRPLKVFCYDATPDFCSTQCANDLRKHESDCCLYAYNVIFLNTTFVACGVGPAGSCTGAFSGEPIVSSL